LKSPAATRCWGNFNINGHEGSREVGLPSPILIRVHLEEHVGGKSQPFHPAGAKYEYPAASNLADKPSRLTERQAVFYRNLIRMAEKLQSQELPLDFLDTNGAHMAMDLGCVKIAEHAGFIEPLTNEPDGRMKTIRLKWLVVPESSNKS
jgi:hypothetical protein